MANRQEFSRADRVRKALMREVSDIIANEVKSPELSNSVISVTDVDLSNDLRHAKVFLSVMGSFEEQEAVMAILTDWQPKIRMMIGQRIRLRFTPEIVLKLDDSLERGTRVTQLLDQISRGEV
jgi:ribosome-binding factor A